MHSFADEEGAHDDACEFSIGFGMTVLGNSEALKGF